MICKKRIVETFEKRPEKQATVLPTEKGIYYAEKVGFGYGTEERIMNCVSENKHRGKTRILTSKTK